MYLYRKIKLCNYNLGHSGMDRGYVSCVNILRQKWHPNCCQMLPHTAVFKRERNNVFLTVLLNLSFSIVHVKKKMSHKRLRVSIL